MGAEGGATRAMRTARLDHARPRWCEPLRNGALEVVEDGLAGGPGGLVVVQGSKLWLGEGAARDQLDHLLGGHLVVSQERGSESEGLLHRPAAVPGESGGCGRRG